MDFNAWESQFIQTIEKLSDSFVDNQFSSPPENEIFITQIEEKLQETLPQEFKDFYSHWGEIRLINIMNGYHILKLSFIWKKFEVFAIQHKDLEEKLFIFGANGGGNLFALSLKDGKVYFLPDPFEQGDKIGTLEPIRLVSYSFNEFLERLLKDVEAFGQNETEYTYLDKLNLQQNSEA